VHEKTIKEETTFDPAAVNSATSRHRRWDELMKQNKGRIDINLAKRFEADHYDVVRKREGGSANTLCGHVDLDQRGCPEWDWATFYPGGTVNAKVADSQLAKRMTMWASAGHPCGTGFRLEPFLKDHPEYSWSRDIAGDMPSGAWTMFSINSRKVTEEVGVRRTVHQDGPYYDNRRNNSNDGVPTYPNPRKP
jgi:hypothetical protein